MAELDMSVLVTHDDFSSVGASAPGKPNTGGSNGISQISSQAGTKAATPTTQNREQSPPCSRHPPDIGSKGRAAGWHGCSGGFALGVCVVGVAAWFPPWLEI